MDNILEFKRKEEHVSGNALCLICDHKWVAVAPVGTQALECPSCHTIKGVFTQLVSRQTEDHLQCGCCGSEFYAITPKGPYCINCGKYAKF
jgi:transcription elongation factor Elf1